MATKISLSEKAGTPFIPGAKVDSNGSLADQPVPGVPPATGAVVGLMLTVFLTHFNTRNVPANIRALALWQNNAQRYAQDSTRPGIPVTVASDPRNHFSNPFQVNAHIKLTRTAFMMMRAVGPGASNDEQLTRQLADMSQQE